MSKQFYRLCLEDYSSASFTSFGKYYFGTLEMISDFIEELKSNADTAKIFHNLISAYEDYMCGNKSAAYNVAHQEVPLLVPAKILAQRFSQIQRHNWEHLNTWHWIYDMRCDKADSEHLWISSKGEFFRCIQTKFVRLQYKNISRKYVPISAIWGHPGIITITDTYLQNKLFVIEKSFSTKSEALENFYSFKQLRDIDFSAIINDIFGDG